MQSKWGIQVTELRFKELGTFVAGGID